MFKKRKEKEKNEIAGLVALQETSLGQISEQLAEAEGITDSAEKILALEKLNHDIDNAHEKVNAKMASICLRRYQQSSYSVEEITGQIVEQNPGIFSFEDTLSTQKLHVSEMLNDTAANCSLEDIANSPLYDKVFQDSQAIRNRIRDHFKVAADTQTTKGKPAAVQEKASAASAKSGSTHKHYISDTPRCGG